jgi:hypothetical protein
MINILIIFFYTISQEEKNDLLVKISTINQKIQGWYFCQFFLSFHEPNEGDKNDLWAIISS